MYKLKLLSDDSFYIVDEFFELVLFKHIFKKRITIKDYLLDTNKYKDYFLCDVIDNTKVLRSFEITEPTKDEEKLPIGVRIKYAKDIRKGDLVMGVNNEPEKVIDLHKGTEPMYDININGETYTVNESHILELVDKDTGEHLQMQVGVYVNMDDEFKSHYEMEIVDF